MPLSNEEIREILSKPVEIWPECRCEHYCKPRGYKREPSPDQKKAFVIPHQHGLDIVLAYGGTRLGKSKVSVAKGMEYAFTYPGCTMLVGADTREILKRTAMKDWQELLTIHDPWDHPLVYRKPNDHNKALILRIPYKKPDGTMGTKLTTVWFLHFRDFKILRGTGVCFVHIEEASLIKEADVMKELIRRCDATYVKQRMIFISTNPEESKGWLHEEFSLRQFEPEYSGGPMDIGERCKCQFCQSCMNVQGDSQEFKWEDGKCPNCGAVKSYACPGNVDFKRVVMFTAAGNPHVPPDYFQTNLASTSEVEAQLYLMGKVVELRQGKAYDHFTSRENLLPGNIPLDYSKEMVWSFDFNVPRQCSVICQERISPGGTDVHVVDEIVLPNAGPEKIAKEFLFRYPTYDKPIYIYGDPAAVNNKIRDNDASQYMIISDIISDPLKRYKGELLHLTEDEAKKYIALGGVPKKVKTFPTKNVQVGVVLKVDSLNHKLKSPSGKIGIFVNPSCKWLIRSLEDMRWAEKAGRPALDCRCDKADSKNPDKFTVRLVSHITDALGYYIAKKWPMKREVNNTFVVVPGDSTIEIDKEGNTIVNKIPLSREEQDFLKSQERVIDTIRFEPGSILEMISRIDDDDEFRSFYG